MFNPMTYITTTAGKIVIGLLILIAVAAYCEHDGITRESNRRDAHDLVVQHQVDESYGRMLDRGLTAAAAAAAKDKTITIMADQLKRRTDNAKESDLAVSNQNCGAPRAADNAGSGSPACLVTRYFVGLWNDAWRLGGEAAKPVQSDPAGITPAEREPTAVGPRQLIDNERINAASCAGDRQRFDKLNSLLSDLEREWDRSHE